MRKFAAVVVVFALSCGGSTSGVGDREVSDEKLEGIKERRTQCDTQDDCAPPKREFPYHEYCVAIRDVKVCGECRDHGDCEAVDTESGTMEMYCNPIAQCSQCAEDAHCGEGEKCSSQGYRCVCTSDDACPDGQTCHDGACKEP